MQIENYEGALEIERAWLLVGGLLRVILGLGGLIQRITLATPFTKMLRHLHD